MSIALLIPISARLTSLAIGLLIIAWIAERNFITRWIRLKHNKESHKTFSFCLFYLLYAAGLLYTTNQASGWFDMQVKLSLLIFPLIISTWPQSRLSLQNITRLLFMFLAGCMVETVYFFIVALSEYLSSGSTSTFYYTRLAIHHHTTFFSMYLNFAEAAILYLLITGKKSFTPALRILLKFLLLWFFIFIILLSSKAGMLTFILIGVMGGMLMSIYNKKIYSSVIAILIITGLFTIAWFLFPPAFQRLQVAQKAVINRSQIQADTQESTAERVLLWKTATQVALQHWTTGVGTGDVQDTFSASYAKQHLTEAHNKNFNAHNQYLQTFAAIGIIGLLALLAMLLLPARSAFLKSNILYLLFLVIIAFNLLFESMLERQAGIIFYAFFNTLLFYKRRELRYRSSPI